MKPFRITATDLTVEANDLGEACAKLRDMFAKAVESYQKKGYVYAHVGTETLDSGILQIIRSERERTDFFAVKIDHAAPEQVLMRHLVSEYEKGVEVSGTLLEVIRVPPAQWAVLDITPGGLEAIETVTKYGPLRVEPLVPRSSNPYGGH